MATMEECKKILKRLYFLRGFEIEFPERELYQSIAVELGTSSMTSIKGTASSWLKLGILEKHGNVYSYGSFGYEILGVEPKKRENTLRSDEEAVLQAETPAEKGVEES